MTIPRFTPLLAFMALFFIVPASGIAQEPENLTLNVGGGYAGRAGAIKDRFRPSGVFSAGAGYRFTPWFSESVQFTYFDHRLSQALLNEAQAPDGNAHTWSMTLDPMVHLFKSTKLPYLVGGIGYYRRTVQFTNPILVNTIAFDPFFNVFFRVTIPADQVIRQSSVGGFGANIGGGLDFKIHDGPSLFIEARYHRANTGQVHTDMLPITVGFRW